MLIWKVETAVPTDRTSRQFHGHILLSTSLPPGELPSATWQANYWVRHDRRITYNVTLRRVRVTTVAVGKQ